MLKTRKMNLEMEKARKSNAPIGLKEKSQVIAKLVTFLEPIEDRVTGKKTI